MSFTIRNVLRRRPAPREARPGEDDGVRRLTFRQALRMWFSGFD